MRRPGAGQLANVLNELLKVINPDKEGGYFICEEARDTVDKAAETLQNFLKY